MYTVARLEKDLGGYDEWRDDAIAKGFKLDHDKKGLAALGRLVSDSLKHQERFRITFKKAKSSAEKGAARKQQWKDHLTLYRALDELAAKDTKAAFEVAFRMLSTVGEKETGAFYLNVMTDLHYPVRGNLSLDSGLTIVDLTPRCIAAWSAWRKENDLDKLKKPSAENMEKVKRRMSFWIDSRRRKGGVFDWPAKKIIEEMSTEEDTQTLAVLASAIERNPLNEEDARELISAAEKSKDHDRRFYIWRALASSTDEASQKCMVDVIDASADAETVLRLLGLLDGLKPGHVSFLTGLYDRHGSDKVKAQIVERLAVRGPGHFDKAAEDTRSKLIDWMLENARSVEHKVRALHGLASLIQLDVDDRMAKVLEREKSVEIRRTVYTLAMSRRSYRYVKAMLGADEAEDTKLAGLKALSDSLFEVEEQYGIPHQELYMSISALTDVRDTMMAALRNAVAKDASAKVKTAAATVLARVRDEYIDGMLRQENLQTKQTIEEFAARKKESGAAPVDAIKRIIDRTEHEFDIDKRIEDLKELFGTIPNEAGLLRKFEAVQKIRLQKLELLLR